MSIGRYVHFRGGVLVLLTQGRLTFLPQLGVVRFFHVLVAENLLQRAYDEHLFGVGPLDHVNRPRGARATISVGGPWKSARAEDGGCYLAARN